MAVDPLDMVVAQILDRLKDNLTKGLQTDILPTDPTWVKEVKAGRFQDDPVATGNFVVVMNGDLDDPNEIDGNTDMKRQIRHIGFDVPSREIGGTEMWYRRGTARVNCFFIQQNYSETLARRYAMTVMGRVEQIIASTHVADLRDPFMEHAVKCFCFGNTFFQSGGPPGSYIWRGKAMWQVLTERRWDKGY